MKYSEFTLEGRNAVIEAYRAGKTIDKLFIFIKWKRTIHEMLHKL